MSLRKHSILILSTAHFSQLLNLRMHPDFISLR